MTDQHPPELDDFLGELVDESRENWLPEEPANAAGFQRSLRRRMRRRRGRNAALTGGAAVIAIVGAVLLLQPPDSEVTEPSPDVVATIDEDADSGEESGVSVEEKESVEETVASPQRVEVAAGDRPTVELDGSDVDVWYGGVLGAPPAPTEWGDEYGVLGALYVNEVEL